LLAHAVQGEGWAACWLRVERTRAACRESG
jgi:hypothetical protein